jgi:hypothetical protein
MVRPDRTRSNGAAAASLVVRPPLDTGAATWRLAIGLALFFALAPAPGSATSPIRARCSAGC